LHSSKVITDELLADLKKKFHKIESENDLPFYRAVLFSARNHVSLGRGCNDFYKTEWFHALLGHFYKFSDYKFKT
jgi:hypothetical protein